MQAPGRDRDRPWVYHPHTFRGLSPLFHWKSTQELQLPGRGESDTEGLVRKLPCCSGAAFRRKLLFPLGFRAWFWFLPLLKKKPKTEFPDLHQSKNFIYKTLKKTNAFSSCLKYRGNTELGHWKPAQSSAGQGTNLRIHQLCFGKCNSYYNDIESNF